MTATSLPIERDPAPRDRADADPPLLDVRNLRVHIRTERGLVTVVDDVSLNVRANEVLCIVGESGSGKSVTMLSVMRLMDERAVSYEGSVNLDGTDLLMLSERRMQAVRGSAIAMIFQDPMTALNPVYRIGWQIAEQIRAHGDVSSTQARARTLELLRAVGISDPERRIDNYPYELSGGMRQRVMIALALSCRPQILIADEPTTALDVTVQSQILRLITDLKDDVGMAVVLVTHDMGVVAEVADRVQVMYAGRVVEQGTAAEIFDDARHPYTVALLRSIPRLDRPKPRRLPSIGGAPASAGQIGAECVFAARCPYRFDACSVQPTLVAVGAVADHGASSASSASSASDASDASDAGDTGDTSGAVGGSDASGAVGVSDTGGAGVGGAVRGGEAGGSVGADGELKRGEPTHRVACHLNDGAGIVPGQHVDTSAVAADTSAVDTYAADADTSAASAVAADTSAADTYAADADTSAASAADADTSAAAADTAASAVTDTAAPGASAASPDAAMPR